MPPLLNNIHSIFISYSSEDRIRLQQDLLSQLSQAGITTTIEHRNFTASNIWLSNPNHPIWQSSVVLLILSSHTNTDKLEHFKALLAGLERHTGRKPKVLVITIEPVDAPKELAKLPQLYLIDVTTHIQAIQALLEHLHNTYHVAISYKSNIETDKSLAGELANGLHASGYQVTFEQEVTDNTRWIEDKLHQIKNSDAVIVLLSAESVWSELLAKEVAFAYKHFQKSGHPKILPVRLNYAGRLPYQLQLYLEGLPFAEWHEQADTKLLVAQLDDTIGHGQTLSSTTEGVSAIHDAGQEMRLPAAYADPSHINARSVSGNMMILPHPFYIRRDADSKLERSLLSQHGTTTTIRAPRQTGKSSLLIEGVKQAQVQGSHAVFIDLQLIDEIFLENTDRFLRYFATIIVNTLGLDLYHVDSIWSGPLAATQKLSSLMEDYVLPQIDTKLILAIDEIEHLLNVPYRDNFFGLMRSWHNNRARNESRWKRLDLVMVIATDPNMLIQDIKQSPFNVGQTITLEDLNISQIAELSAHYGSPLDGPSIGAIHKLLGGHPYLTSRALYTMQAKDLTWSELTQTAISNRGLFADHLHCAVWTLHEQPELRNALQLIIDRERCDDQLFFRLMQAGLAKGVDGSSCAVRCKLYEEYLLTRHILQST
jgi:hypothetical protein